MRPAVERAVRTRALDALIIELSHRWRRHQSVERSCRQLPIVIVSAAQIDQHVTLRSIVTNTLNEAASRRVRTSEWLEIDRAAIFDVDGLSARRYRDQQEYD